MQAGLFPDDSVPDELVGYRGPSACQIAGITYRQLDYWARTSLVVPSIRGAAGSGSQRLYSFKDILVLKIVKRLLDTGISLHNIRVAVDHLRQRGVKDLANITLFSDGTTVYECTSAEEVVDLLQGGQGVFGIAVSGAMRELTGAIADFPGERADGGESIAAPGGRAGVAAQAPRPQDRLTAVALARHAAGRLGNASPLRGRVPWPPATDAEGATPLRQPLRHPGPRGAPMPLESGELDSPAHGERLDPADRRYAESLRRPLRVDDRGGGPLAVPTL